MRAHRSRTACGRLPDARASGAPSLSARSRVASCSSCSARRSYASCAMRVPPIRVSMPRGVDIATLDPSVTGEPKSGPAAFWRTVIDRVRQTPAVESASLARVPPGGFEGIGLGGVAPGDQPARPTCSLRPGTSSTSATSRRSAFPSSPGGTSRRPTRLGLRPWSWSARRSRDGSGPDSRRSENLCRLEVFNARDRRAEPRVSTVVGVAGDIRSSSLIDGLAEPVRLPAVGAK